MERLPQNFPLQEFKIEEYSLNYKNVSESEQAPASCVSADWPALNRSPGEEQRSEVRGQNQTANQHFASDPTATPKCPPKHIKQKIKETHKPTQGLTRCVGAANRDQNAPHDSASICELVAQQRRSCC